MHSATSSRATSNLSDESGVKAALAAIGRRVTDKADQNRIDYPQCAEAVDLLQAKFGKVKVICVMENGKTVGIESTGWIAWRSEQAAVAPRLSRKPQ